ncbi:MAG: alpha/beta fold hydrolase [Acidobacteria bacterium]|nr:alpha/beta fold hydrolase [Acidobacteriota bacterium]
MITLLLLLFLLFVSLLICGPLAFFWKGRRSSVLRWSVASYLVVSALALFAFGPYWLARLITHAGTRPSDLRSSERPSDYGLAYEEVDFQTGDGLTLRAWFIPPGERTAVVIGTHGLFRNRVELLPRAAPLCRAGYGALLFDSRSHGTSDRGMVTLGYHEKQDVLGAVRFIERRYGATSAPPVVLMGVSMGAVAVLEAAAQSRGYSALILDSPFSGLRQTVADHTRLLMGLPRFPFATLFLRWFERLTGVDPGQVDSSAALREAQPVPLLIIASEGDERIPDDVARKLYTESRAGLKVIRVFGRDVPHGAAARIHPQEYADAVLSFLDEALP